MLAHQVRNEDMVWHQGGEPFVLLEEEINTAMRAGHADAISDLRQRTDLTSMEEHLLAAGLRAVLRVPLVSAGELLGGLNLARYTPGDFAREEVESAFQVANSLAIAIHQAQLTARLRESEARYRAVSELSSDFSFGCTITPDGEIAMEWITEAFPTITGYTREEVTDRGWMNLLTPQDRERIREKIRRGELGSGEYRVRAKDGEWRWLRVRTRTEADPQTQRVARIMGAVQDITAQKRSETSLRAALSRTQALYSVASALIAAEDLPMLLTTLAERIAEVLPADRIALFVLNEKHSRIEHSAFGGPGFTEGPPVDITLAELQEGLSGWAMRERRAAVSAAGQEDPRESARVRARRQDLNAGAIVVAPLLYRDAVLGTVTAVNRPEQRDFTGEDADLLLAMANQVSLTLQNFRLFEETRQVKNFNENIVEGIAEAILQENAGGTLTFANPAAADLSGYRRIALVGMPRERLLPDNETLRRARQTGSLRRYETALVNKEGESIPVLVSVRPLFDEETYTGCLFALVDITERKRTEETLVRLSTAVQTTSDSVIICDLEGYVLDCNAAALQLHALEAVQDIYGCNFYSLIAEGDRQRAVRDVVRLVAQGVVPRREYHVLTARQRQIPVEMSLSLMHREGQEPAGFVAVSRDITARKRAEMALRESEQQYRALYQQREQLLEVERQQRVLAETLVEIAAILNSSLDREEILQRLLDQIARVVDYDDAVVTLITRGIQQVVVHRGRTPYQAPSAPARHLPHIRAILEARAAVIIYDTQQDDRWPYPEQTERIRSWMGVPLTVRDEVIGVLNLSKNTPNFYHPYHGELAFAFANQAAIAIDNARLYAQARQDAETKATLLQEVNHRVKNNLAAIIGLLYTEQRYVQEEADSVGDGVIARMISRIQGLARVHSMLSETEWAPLRLDQLARQIVNSALQILPTEKAVHVDVTHSSIEVISKQAMDLAIVLNELATNTVKYGMRDRERGRIHVDIYREGEWVVLEFENDGPGYPPEILDEHQYSVGLHLVETIVERNLRGTFELRNTPGPVTTVRFKAAGASPPILTT